MLLFISLYALCLAISLVVGASYYRKFKRAPNSENDEKTKLWVKENFGASELDDVAHIKPFLYKPIKNFFGLIHTMMSLPIFILRFGLISRFGIQIVWRLPVQLYEVWWSLNFALCYYIAIEGSQLSSLIIASLLTISLLFSITDNLDVEKGRLKIINKPNHKLMISELLTEASLIMVGFACIYYCLALNYKNSFNQSLTILDSIYYSVMVSIAVGFDQIHPTSTISKIITMTHSILSYLFIVFIVAVFISVWTSNRMRRTISKKSSEIDETPHKESHSKS